MFEGRKLLIATKHKKEKVIAPLFAESLKVECLVSEGFDTDTLGTFTGEVERVDDPLATARNKCLKAMDMYHCDLGIASEGSFGPHPLAFFLQANEEILLFTDRKNKLEIVVRELSTETNFAGEEIRTEEELKSFAERALFPSHALILRKSKTEAAGILKGITDWEQLLGAFHQLRERYEAVYCETDMRALYNPSRMRVIAKAVGKLLEKINSCCPHCHTPGFGVSSARPGLPCGLCGSPTPSTLSYWYTCQQCAFSSEEIFPHKKEKEDPAYCQQCNP